MHGEDAPCDECDSYYPSLLDQNIKAWEHWGVMSTYDRPQGNGFGGIPTINSKTIRDYCGDFDFSELEYKKILTIEMVFKESMIENQKRKERIEKNKEEFSKKNFPQPVKSNKR